jgi:hypothetical protein
MKQLQTEYQQTVQPTFDVVTTFNQALTQARSATGEAIFIEPQTTRNQWKKMVAGFLISASALVGIFFLSTGKANRSSRAEIKWIKKLGRQVA